MKTQKPKRRRVRKVLLIIFVSVVVIAALGLGLFAYTNLNYDKAALAKIKNVGFTEKQVTLPNKTVLNYGEGPDNGQTPLLLINGQTMQWEDYARVLPQLSAQYKVYAIDCHGHGESSHDPARYTCAAMSEDFVWFIENVIKQPCVLSGLSSGGILCTNIAATSPQNTLGLIIEDSPFFSVLPDEMQNTFVYLDGFKIAHDYLNQTREKYYVPYYFRNGYLARMLGGLGKTIADAAQKVSERTGEECTRIWFVPYSWTHGVAYMNTYDMRFADTFYSGAWFEGVSQEEMLAGVQVPTVYIKAKTSYKDGVQFCANDDEDAAKVMSLLKDGEIVRTDTSNHNIHFDYPDFFVKVLTDFKAKL